MLFYYAYMYGSSNGSVWKWEMDLKHASWNCTVMVITCKASQYQYNEGFKKVAPTPIKVEIQPNVTFCLIKKQ